MKKRMFHIYIILFLCSSSCAAFDVSNCCQNAVVGIQAQGFLAVHGYLPGQPVVGKTMARKSGLENNTAKDLSLERIFSNNSASATIAPRLLSNRFSKNFRFPDTARRALSWDKILSSRWSLDRTVFMERSSNRTLHNK